MHFEVENKSRKQLKVRIAVARFNTWMGGGVSQTSSVDGRNGRRTDKSLPSLLSSQKTR